MKKYLTVSDRIKKLIESGVLKSRDKIPSIREMSVQMNLSMMTILNGYRLLEEQGIIASHPQSGYYVRPENMRFSHSAISNFIESDTKIKILTDHIKISPETEALLEDSMREDIIPLGIGFPYSDAKINEEISLHLSRRIRENPDKNNRYNFGRGNNALREIFSRKMIESFCETSSDEIIITSGATPGLLSALLAVTKTGDSVAVESPGYHGFFGLIAKLGLKALEIQTDCISGFDVDTFEKTVKKKKISAVILSPNFSNPTGAKMPDSAKERLALISAKYGIPVIEDDSYGDLFFSSKPRAVKSYNPDNTIYVSSLSKSIAPGYKTGWVAGGIYQKDIHRILNTAYSVPSAFIQSGLASFMTKSFYTHSMKKLRRIYRENISAYQSFFSENIPECEVSNPEGGFFLWIKAPQHIDSRKTAYLAVKNGFTIAPGIIFSARNNFVNYFRLNSACLFSEKTEKALKIFAELIRK